MKRSVFVVLAISLIFIPQILSAAPITSLYTFSGYVEDVVGAAGAVPPIFAGEAITGNFTYIYYPDENWGDADIVDCTINYGGFLMEVNHEEPYDLLLYDFPFRFPTLISHFYFYIMDTTYFNTEYNIEPFYMRFEYDNGLYDGSLGVPKILDDFSLSTINFEFYGDDEGPYYNGSYYGTITSFERIHPPVSEPVPEPATIILAGLGLFGLMGRRKFSKSCKS